ncbi:hypothetical protein KL864_26995 [Mycolicibacterium goodii]|uniref:phage gene 29 protein family protein n=1 Tax=Mycolicibacterium goodii TaxID=134601 RepID=UPI001BDCD3A0|nr:hypothetical protein [Mycolicibacterium goodii]MBU8819537.1 hypothetical protein [Mycolicibacterium goodii]
MSHVVEPPKINVRQFPYHRRWTQAELDEVYERFEKIRTVLTDVVAPHGAPLYIDPSMVAILALHASLAGCDVHDDKAFIEHRVRNDEYGLFEGVHEWRVKGDFDPDDKPEDPVEAKARAAELREKLRTEVDPKILAELKRQIAEEFTTETTEARKRGRRVKKEGR